MAKPPLKRASKVKKAQKRGRPSLKNGKTPLKDGANPRDPSKVGRQCKKGYHFGEGANLKGHYHFGRGRHI